MFKKNKTLGYAVFIVLLMSMTEIALHASSDNAQADALSFVSTPTTEAFALYKYDYLVVPSNYSANLTLYWTNATWAQLLIVNWHLVGFPNASDYGRVWMSLRLELMGTEYAWQNFTIDVVALAPADVYIPPDYGPEIIDLIVAFLFGFGLMVAGFKRSEFFVLAGVVWVFCGMTIFITYGMVFLLVSAGLGIVLMFKGVSPYL